MAYQPIEDYGLIGNMRTAALVGLNGSIDWFCYPHFDSPSVFAAILDDEKGGCFRVEPVGEDVHDKQFYWPDTNVLITRFLNHEGVGEIEDYMPVGGDEESRRGVQIVRRVRVARGHMHFRLTCAPAFDYARAPAEVRLTEHGAVFSGGGVTLGLSADVALHAQDGRVTAEFGLHESEQKTFTLSGLSNANDCAPPLTGAQSEELFEDTLTYWRNWLRQSRYKGRWRSMVDRSALTLKLLTFEPTGAIIAAPTCSLPNRVGGGRNWDFRYTWIRDAAFTLYALLRLGFTTEAARFMEWLDHRYPEQWDDQPLQIMYGVQGRTDLHEYTLPHLKGYKGSRPVRLGNRAHRTLQLDIYGELLDAIYLYNKHGAHISDDTWRRTRALVNWVCEHWDRPDEGIWEVRNEPRHFVYSKLMCWVALDRGLRLSQKRSLPADDDRWRDVRDRIYEEILEKGWDAQRRTFVQAYGNDCLDGSLLMMPLVFFMAPNDPKMLSTIDAINRPPGQGGLVSDGLVYRFDPTALCGDGVEGEEGTFNMCSFWLVEALTRAGRTNPARLEQARLLFERMLGYSNHLGLYAEQTGGRGEALGNFPQALTHLGLISAAFNLDRTLEGG